MTGWHVGQSIVCINDDVIVGLIFSGTLKKGSVYTIRDIVREADNFGFRLNEIVRARTILRDEEMAFLHSYFRPLVDAEADISEFTSILARVNQREVVDA